jgi:hypothetical protein
LQLLPHLLLLLSSLVTSGCSCQLISSSLLPPQSLLWLFAVRCDSLRAITSRDSPLPRDDGFRLFVADTGNNCIRCVLSNGSVETVAGGLQSGFSDGVGADARFNHPSGVATDSYGYVYIADTDNHAIRRLSPDGTVITIAGNGTVGNVDGRGSEARLSHPCGITVRCRVLVVNRVRPGGGAAPACVEIRCVHVTEYACNPMCAQVDSEGLIYVADTGNHIIRKITPDGVVVTIAGCGRIGYCDGFGGVARFCSPCVVCSAAHYGVIYTSEHGCNVIRAVVQVRRSSARPLCRSTLLLCPTSCSLCPRDCQTLTFAVVVIVCRCVHSAPACATGERHVDAAISSVALHPDVTARAGLPVRTVLCAVYRTRLSLAHGARVYELTFIVALPQALRWPRWLRLDAASAVERWCTRQTNIAAGTHAAAGVPVRRCVRRVLREACGQPDVLRSGV